MAHNHSLSSNNKAVETDGNKKIKTFVVFDLILMPIFGFVFPLFEFRNGEETVHYSSFRRLDNRGYKFFQEWKSEQRRPVMVDEVDYQTFNMRSIL